MADAAALSTLTIAELAYGIHHDDPMAAAAREARYQEVLGQFSPVPYSARAAHLCGAIAASLRKSGRSPRPRRIDLKLGAVVLTRNPIDFVGIGESVSVIGV